MNMKLKHRKGSTLALTLMIFAVLMIFGTFILSFMVTENKQAMYHQNKTQAYYIARSGAVAVREAVSQIAEDDDLRYDFIMKKIPTDNILGTDSNISINGSTYDFTKTQVKLYKIFKGTSNLQISEETVQADMYDIIISSSATIGNAKEEVVITIPAKLAAVDSPLNSSVLVYLDDADPILKNLKDENGKYLVIKGSKDEYKEHSETNTTYNLVNKDGMKNLANYLPIKNKNNVTKVILEGEYFYNGNLDLTDHEIKTNGSVKVYVEGGLKIHEADVNTAIGDDKKNLTFYIYGENLNLGNYSLLVGNTTGKEIVVKSTFYVKDGPIKFDTQKLIFESDLFSNGNLLELATHSNSNEHVDLKGIIIAPNALVKIATDDNNKSAINITGLLVGNFLKYNGKDIGKLVLKPSDEIDNVYIPHLEIFKTFIGEGYFVNR